MAGRVRRYLRRIGIAVLGLVIGLMLLNFGLGWHYRRGAAAIEREMAAKGYPATFAEVLDRQVVPEGARNGADDLLEAFTLFNDEGVDYGLVPVMGVGVRLSPDETIPEESLREIQKILDLNRETLSRISSGVRAEYVRIPLRLNIEDWDLLPEDFHKHLRMCARLVHLQALYAGHSDDPATALHSIDTLIRLGGHMTHQPVVITYFNGSAILGMAQAAAEDLMERGYVTSADDFDRLADLFDAAAIGDLANAVWADVLMHQEMFDAGYRAAIQQAEEDGESHSLETWIGCVTAFGYVHSFMYDLEARLARGIGLAVSESLDVPVTASSTRRVDELTFPGAPVNWCFVTTLPMEFDLARQYPHTVATARARVETAAVAVRTMRFRAEHRRLPNATEFSALMDEVRDPVGGGPLLYRSHETEFAVYSIGKNGLDDDGVFLDPDTKIDDVGMSIQLPPSN